MSFVVRAPASTANLGPGFDCAAAALELWNEVHVEQRTNGEASRRPVRQRKGHIKRGSFAEVIRAYLASPKYDALAKSTRPGKIDQQPHRLSGHAMLCVVEIPTRGLDAHAVPVALLREELSNRARAHRCGMPRERVPDRVRHRARRRTGSAGGRSAESRPRGSTP